MGISSSGFRPSLQDRDLFQRMTTYFDSIDSRLQHGEGWLVFNAVPQRASRIVSLIHLRLQENSQTKHFFVPWRDFSLTSYMVEVELQSTRVDIAGLPPQQKHQIEIASKISQQTMVRMVTDDILIINGVAPRNSHEVRYLCATIDARYTSRLATIMLVRDSPEHLGLHVSRLGENGAATWDHVSTRLYETCLIAI
jgi:hypothetical protein